MTPTSILRELEKLPLADRILVVEQALESIKIEKEQSLHAAVNSLHEDYQSDQKLTVFTQLDGEAFTETASETERAAKIMAGLKLAYERMLEFKRQKNSVVVVARDGKIVHLAP